MIRKVWKRIDPCDQGHAQHCFPLAVGHRLPIGHDALRTELAGAYRRPSGIALWLLVINLTVKASIKLASAAERSRSAPMTR